MEDNMIEVALAVSAVTTIVNALNEGEGQPHKELDFTAAIPILSQLVDILVATPQVASVDEEQQWRKLMDSTLPRAIHQLLGSISSEEDRDQLRPFIDFWSEKTPPNPIDLPATVDFPSAGSLTQRMSRTYTAPSSLPQAPLKSAKRSRATPRRHQTHSLSTGSLGSGSVAIPSMHSPKDFTTTPFNQTARAMPETQHVTGVTPNVT